MSELLGIARFKFHEGKREEYLRLSDQAMDVVRTKDAGTLGYDLYLNGDQTECMVVERYRDSDAAIEHQASPPTLRVWLQFVNEMSVDRGIELDTPAGRLEWSRITACGMAASGPHGPGWTLSVGAADRSGSVGHYRAVLSAADFVGGGDH